MVIFREGSGLSAWLVKQADKGKLIGFVPTMGALHRGHMELVARSRTESDLTVCSIFVNPTQFNDPGDYDKYPVTVDRDIQLLTAAQNDILYLPSVSDIYPNGIKDLPDYDLGVLETILEGKYRPGHFQGVCQVVDRLLGVVRPGKLFMGRKDYQQCMVIRKLLHLRSLSTALVTCETVRESDGLAMSSRNARLSPAERARAPLIFQVLGALKDGLRPGPLAGLIQTGKEKLEVRGFRVDYVEICNAYTLQPVAEWDGRTALVALIAAFNGPVRLIDNLQISL
jgi:pantoate--beta-alanine ligase